MENQLYFIENLFIAPIKYNYLNTNEKEMARTINGALNELVQEKVNLLKSRTDAGRSSRDHLLGQIKRLNENSVEKLDFADTYNLPFGSFSRRTKVKPLDDIDQMIGLNGGKLVWNEESHYDQSVISIRNSSDKGVWSQLLNDDNTLSPIKVLNRFKRMLSNMNGYQNPQLNRHQQAVTFQMTSNEWNFDLVPCFHTTTNVYLIPSGNGNYWMQTDPRKDQVLATEVNQQHNGRVLEIIRLMKYWNKLDRKPSIPSSYLLEVMLLNFYKSRSLWNLCGSLQEEVEKCLQYLKENIYSYVADPKEIEGNINRLGIVVQHSIYNRIINDLEQISVGNYYESLGQKEQAFKHWKNVFGSYFPIYE
ncbi:SMODS domain-containing nucleotidyltransferase [Acinetobacter bereziniae]|uniref:SMODS domain-containing nucleotidyltransferase n=1 Tax=Acinetobacter bereziniae TaxID=106648 RepID=UPI0030190FD9